LASVLFFSCWDSAVGYRVELLRSGRVACFYLDLLVFGFQFWFGFAVSFLFVLLIFLLGCVFCLVVWLALLVFGSR